MNWEDRKKYYNKRYYDDQIEGKPYAEWWWTDDNVWIPRAKLVVEAFSPTSVLVCGCAKGSLVHAILREYNIDAYGFDLSEYAINTCPYDNIRNRLIVQDIALQPLPFNDLKFDVSVCFDFFEHQDNEHIQTVCNEIQRVTNRTILVRQPFYKVDDPKHYISALKGASFNERLSELVSDGIEEFMPDQNNIEHPNTMPRQMFIKMFGEFVEGRLDPQYYDMLMGDNINPVLPFWESMVLDRI